MQVLPCHYKSTAELTRRSGLVCLEPGNSVISDEAVVDVKF